MLPRDKSFRAYLGLKPLVSNIFETDRPCKNNELGANGFYLFMLMSCVVYGTLGVQDASGVDTMAQYTVNH
jgi:hypothetical protein